MAGQLSEKITPALPPSQEEAKKKAGGGSGNNRLCIQNLFR